jgi:hypothetical protein
LKTEPPPAQSGSASSRLDQDAQKKRYWAEVAQTDDALAEDALAEKNIEKLIARLPNWAAKAAHFIRRPRARWVRLPVAICLIPGGLLGFLPVLGLWMLPLAFLLLSVDVPILRRSTHRFINWLAARHPAWFR